MTTQTRHLVFSALFIALGVVTPILFHWAGLGSYMLPLFWPVAASVFFIPTLWTVAIGVSTPLLSMFITGMPPFPVVVLIALELPVLVALSGLLYDKTRLGSLFALAAGLAASRTTTLILAVLLAPLLGLPPKMASIAYLIQSLPGIAAILIFIPLILLRFSRIPVFWKGSDRAAAAS